MQTATVSKLPAALNKAVLKKYGIDSGESSIENEDTQDDLASFVRKKFNEAETHKRTIGIEARLLRNLYAKKCEYQAGDIENDGVDVYIGISALKARAAEAWMTDILINNIDKPWTIASTPIPNLPDVLKEQVVQMLIDELSTFNNIQDIKERAKELKTVALDKAKEAADLANGKMEQVIDDQFTEGGFRTTFEALIEDISTYPAVFVRGPVSVSRKVAVWDGNKYAASMTEIPSVRIINPFDAYPSPTSTTPQDGEYFIERCRMLPSLLYNAIGVKNFDEVNIRRALNQYDSGFSLNLSADAERDRLEQNDITVSPNAKSGTIDVLVYNGLMQGKYLIEAKVLVSDPQKFYECEVWLAGDYVVKAVLNPNILDKRPIYSTSYVKVNRNIWGQSVICLTYDCMRTCNAASRAAIKNAAFCSGPIGEAVTERIADGTDPKSIRPYTLISVTPDLTGTGGPAIKYYNVAPVLGELMSLYDKYSAIADDLSGIPPYVLGNPQVAGAGRTLGGLSMLMGNAAKGIKRVQVNVDFEILTPLVTAYYDYNMQVSKDTAIKADAYVVARGATGLLQRELAQSKLIEILQMLTPYIPNWDNLPSGIKVILREVLKQTGLPIDDVIPDPKKQEELMAKVRELGQSQAFTNGGSAPQNLPTQSLPPPQPQAGPMPVGLPQGNAPQQMMLPPPQG